MLITCQKCWLRMLGYYIRLCHIIMCNMHETWGLFCSHAMRTLPTSCHVLPHVQRRHVHIMRHAHAGKPATLTLHGVPGFTYGRAIRAG